MGKVYKAHDTVMGRDVAIKVLPPELANEPGYEQRFRREASTAARLTEPHIIPIYEAGEIDGRLYLVMPIIDGIDVHTLLERDGPMSPLKAVQVIEQLASALNAAHKHGLVHRDIKPSNALVTGDDFVYLIDFGIAHDATATRLTSTGMMVGTLAYMAPERFANGITDARSDVYSLACVLYECLTGATPFPGESMEQQIAGHLTLAPPKPSVRNPAVPAGFDEVIATGMAKKPDERYQSARELAIAARQALTAVPAPVAGPTQAAPTPKPLRQRRADSNGAPTQQPQPGATPAKTRQVIERDRLGVLTKIGQGGQGVVYRAPNVKTKFAASMVYKEYKAQTLADIDFSALAAMPALVENSLSYAQAERLISFAAWPCALVEDASRPTGFVMPAIPAGFLIDLTTVKGVSTATAEFQHLLNHASVLAARGITIDDAQRYALLREVASALAFLHKNGVCVGDISPKNLLFSLAPHEAVYFIDCDAMRINSVSALSQMETPGWGVPAGEELATIYSDAYKLGLLALRLLAGDHDTKNLQHIPSTTPDMLHQIITDTLKNQPHSRPLPEAWTYVLGHAIEYAQHHQKTAAAAPVSVAPDAPPIPVLHSRPSVPPSRPSAPPAPVLYSRPPVIFPSTPPPPASAPRRASGAVWAIVITGVAVIAAVVAITVAIAAGNRHSQPTAAPPNSSWTPSSSAADTPTAQTPTATTPTFVPPPALLQGADQDGDAQCAGGFALPRGYRVGPATPDNPNTFTSCAFAIVVGQSYVASNPDLTSPQTQISVNAQSPRVNCPDVASSHPNVQCSGNAFVMQCQEESADQWITCRGGNDAVVYIF